ncbi:MAG: hypothetical protein J6333_05355 [Planctomycetes bacterium]|nr:hypothetical protein [Planctomycetota bacterium]
MNLCVFGEALLGISFGFASQPVNYWRGEQLIARGIPAKLSQPAIKTEDTRQVNVQEHQADFIVRVADLPEGFVPEVADMIDWDGKRYQVSRPAKVPFSGVPANGPCWTWHTRQSHTQLRVHAKYLGEAPEVEDELPSP